MKKLLSAWICLSPIIVSAQEAFCTELQKAIQSVAVNFSDQTEFQYLTDSGWKAYNANFTFRPGEKGIIFCDTIRHETYFFQVITPDTNSYTLIYVNVESCVMQDVNTWKKLDAENHKAVIFSCEKTGGEISIFNSAYGIAIQIERNPSKGIEVIGQNFCDDLLLLANGCDNDFKGLTAEKLDSSVLGVRYRSTIKLNRRNSYNGSVLLSQYIFDKTRNDNVYTEIFSGNDIAWEDLVREVEHCLTDASGWEKTIVTPDNAVRFSKKNVAVIIRKDTTPAPGETADFFVTVENYNTH